MGSPISTGVLRAIRRLYQLGASGIASVERLDDSSPIQIVHDVSREAELGLRTTQDEGFFLIQLQHAIVGIAAQDTAFTFYTAYLNTLTDGTSPDDLLGYVLGASIHVDTLANFNYGTLSLRFPNGYPGELYSPLCYFPMARWSTALTVLSGVSLAKQDVTAGYHLPFRVPPGGVIGCRTASAVGNLTATWSILCWAGPKNAEPPWGAYT